LFYPEDRDDAFLRDAGGFLTGLLGITTHRIVPFTAIAAITSNPTSRKRIHVTRSPK
jgi:hypothetical protein